MAMTVELPSADVWANLQFISGQLPRTAYLDQTHTTNFYSNYDSSYV